MQKQKIFFKIAAALLIALSAATIYEWHVDYLIQKAYQAIRDKSPLKFAQNSNFALMNRRSIKTENGYSTLLIEAIKNNPDDAQAHEIIAQILAFKSTDPNLPEKIYVQNKLVDGRTPIAWAVERGNLKAVELLLKNNARTDIVDPVSGKKPLELVKSEQNSQLREAWHFDEIEKLLTARIPK